MKAKKIVKYLLIAIAITFLANTCGKSYAKFVITRQFKATFSSYPFYFEAAATKNSFDYNASGVTIPINIANYIDNSYNEFNTEYEITLADNTKFQLSNAVNGTIEGNTKKTNEESIKINSVEGADIGSSEVINIVIKSTEPYYKEITIPVTIKKSGELYAFMRDQAQGQTDQYTDFTDSNIVSGVYMNYESKDKAYPVYYYRGDVKNSLIYADHCWQIVRTTETGGLKIVYDGEVKNGQCTDTHDRLGSEPYNNKTNDLASPAQVGYMYGMVETIDTISPSRLEDMGKAPEDISAKIPTDGVLIGKTAEWNGNGYTINDAKTYINETARLIYKDAIDDVEDAEKRYYTCLNTSDTCDTVYYLYKRSGEEVYAIELANNQSLEEAIEGKTLKTGTRFGHDVTWDESTKQYTLTDSIVIEDLDELEDDIRGGEQGNYKNQTPNAFHYTCLNDSGVCNEVYYVYYNDYGNYHDTYASGLFGIKLEDGRNITTTINLLLSESTNEYDSYAKQYIDSWYDGTSSDFTKGDKLIDHADELEDALWCNDRTIAGYHGWDINADNHDSHNKYLHFDAFKRVVGEGEFLPSRPRLSCDIKNDTFTVSNPAGNQKLKYPIALLDVDEAVLAGAINEKATNTYLTATDKDMFFMSPYYVSDDHARLFILKRDGTLESGYAATSYAIKPAIVLKDIFTISGGSGSKEDPYTLQKG